MATNKVKKNNSLTYPGVDKITPKWLYEHVPVYMGVSFFGVLVLVFSLGFGLGVKPFITEWLNERKDSMVQNEDGESIRKMELEISSLNEQINKRDIELGQALKKLDIHKESISSLDSTINLLRDEINKKESEIDEILKQNDLYKKNIADLEYKIKNQTNIDVDKNNEVIKLLQNQIVLLTNEKTSLSEQLKHFQSENSKLLRELESFKNQEKSTDALMGGENVTSEQILASLNKMNPYSADDYLIKIIPKVKGGITCEDLQKMLSSVEQYGRDDVIIKVSSYIKKPLSTTCIKSINNLLDSYNVDKAMEALLK